MQATLRATKVAIPKANPNQSSHVLSVSCGENFKHCFWIATVIDWWTIDIKVIDVEASSNGSKKLFAKTAMHHLREVLGLPTNYVFCDTFNFKQWK